MTGLARIAFGVAALSVVLGLGAAPAAAQFGGLVDIGSATGTIIIVPPGGPAAAPGAPARRQLVAVKIRQVINFQGNNPFNQEDPVNNFNGATFDDLATVIAVSEGGAAAANGAAAAGDLSACIQTIAMAPSATAPPDFRFASFDIDANVGSCNLLADGSTGSALIVQTPPNGDPGFDSGEAFPDALVGLFTIIDPAGNSVRLLDDVPVTITIRATNGFTVAITLKVVSQGGDEFNLVVTNVVEVT